MSEPEDERLASVALANDLAAVRQLLNRVEGGTDVEQLRRLVVSLVAVLQAYAVAATDETVALVAIEDDDEPAPPPARRIIQ